MSAAMGSGTSLPLGATVRPHGVNFSVFSKSSTGVDLLLFHVVNDAPPARVLALDPGKHRTAHSWHADVPGLRLGQIYSYRVWGPFDPHRGLRFDPDKVLLDPYGKAGAVPRHYSRQAACQPGDTTATAMKSVVADPSQYDWEGDTPLQRSCAHTVLYAMHVGGFTRHPSSGLPLATRGTSASVITKIPYVQDLGGTAVELLPVFQCDAQAAPPGLVHYWGYSPVSFFAPHRGYSSRQDPLGPLDEFRDMVKALHRAGIDVILDVVFNHTAEGDHQGPTLCFRGRENPAYYILDTDQARYADYSGTGNTLNANQPIVRRLILDSLHYWVQDMHVDGFRFDLASILSRDESGRPLAPPPILWDIDTDPALAGTKLIAEAWDAAGLYQVGAFSGDRWQQWNGPFRDDVRRFLKGDPGTVTRMASRLLASPDLYGHQEREPEQRINFVTCPDGFPLNDLVSYNQKHNAANGEDNRDGANDNQSWNCGVEGPTDDLGIEALRHRQVKHFLAITLLALGTPMLLMGDAVRRTQHGNNHAYCQDNTLSWFDWTLLERHRDIHRFVRQLIAERLWLRVTRAEPSVSLNELLRQAEMQAHGVTLGGPDWSPTSHSLAFMARAPRRGLQGHLMLHAYWEPLAFELPPVREGRHDGWRRGIDTSLASPQDICAAADAPVVPDAAYLVQPRALVVLWTRLHAEASGGLRPPVSRALGVEHPLNTVVLE